MNPYDATLFTAPDCLPCCAPAPADCSCALLIPPFGSPYADYATALAVVDGSGADEKADCYAYIISTAGITSFSSSVATANHLILNGDGTIAASEPLTVWGSITGQVGDTLSIDWTLPDGDGDSGFWYQVYGCDGTLLEDGGGLGTSGTITLSATLPSDGVYYVSVGSELSPTPPSPAVFSVTADIYSDNPVLVPNPVIALWDDSGTTRRLWACPKLLLPPLTEDSGTWYADCAAADAIIADQVSNCVGYVDTDSGSITSFTATDGGTSLTLAVVLLAANTSSPPSYGGISLATSGTISIAWTATAAGAGRINAAIYDDTGTVVDQTAGPVTTNPFVSTSLPPGRYTVRVQTIDLSGTQTAYSIVITSSGTMSVNEIQARWDNGLTCASTLDCGDSC